MRSFIAWIIVAASLVPFTAHAQSVDQPQRTLQLFADQQRSMRMAAGYSGLLGGAAAIGAGLLADLEYDQDYGQPMWIIGTAVFVSGGISLIAEGSLEGFAEDHRGDAPDALQRAWTEAARSERKARVIGGIVGLSLGAVAAGAGTLIALDAFGMDERPQQDWSVALFLVSGAFLGGGVTALLVESPTEHGYRVAYGNGADEAPIRVAIAGAPSGGMTLGVATSW
jgi:hypothetical protein